MKNKTVLLTGIGGFIGSHFMAHILVNTDWNIVGIDSFNHKGVSERITESKSYQENRDRVKIYTHDLNAPISDYLISKIGYVDYIINLASESHVDRSLICPQQFIQNNINIILNMLEYTRKVGSEVFIQIGTDESYGPALENPHKEWAEIIPSNPYSASKAAQEAIAISYWRSFDIPVVLTNTMNNFAEMQDKEKFIPMTIKNILNNDTVLIHSSSDLKTSGSRYWLHCRNNAAAVLFIIQEHLVSMYPETTKPQRFNIVGEEPISNLNIAKKIAHILNKELHYKMIDAHTQRPGHDLHYALDGAKLKGMGFKYPVDFEDSLVKTIKWTLENERWLK